MRWLVALGVFFLSFTLSAVASAQVLPEDLSELAKPVLDAIMAGQYAYAVALGLVLLVAVARRYGSRHWTFLGTGAGAALLALVGGFGGAMATALGVGASLSADLLWKSLGVAASAAGFFSLAKALVVPVLEKAKARFPKFAVVFDLVLWIFRKPDEAKKAGDAAVAANPGKGAVSIVGEPRDVP